ncbi:Anaphase-promoting complex subunit 7 [Dissophora globulifera]|uniref:Anaphase-promoting complex subunit 7 n=1 Tax=Dissophora globulifera TaxID=979702 RepID=A0A9P6UVL8_9FUNG|nr:Anaphase-promoting complex subunit 7 [Dissophora globulifera]
MEYYGKASDVGYAPFPPDIAPKVPSTDASQAAGSGERKSGKTTTPPPLSHTRSASTVGAAEIKVEKAPLTKQHQERVATKIASRTKGKQRGRMALRLQQDGGISAGVVDVEMSETTLAVGAARDSKEELIVECALAYCKAGLYSLAEEELARIPERDRTVQAHLTQALIACKCGAPVILQPLAIETYIRLLRLNVPLAIVLNMIPTGLEKQWMKTYLQGMDNYIRMRYQEALSDFESLDAQYPRNVDIKLRVRSLDSFIVDGMYHYGVCLKQMSKLEVSPKQPSKADDLNTLAKDLLSVNDKHPDAWCVAALFWELKGETEKALKMVSRALELDSDHCGAHQLRGQIYLESGDLTAVHSFKKALEIEQDIDTFDGLVNTMIVVGEREEALKVAKEVMKLMPESAHALVLYGLAIYHASEQGVEDAPKFLKEALIKKPNCVEAAMYLVMMLEGQSDYEQAIEILDQQIAYQPPHEINVRKGDIYAKMEKWEDAFLAYQHALGANPESVRAKEGLTQVEKILSGGDDDDEEDDAEESENELELDVVVADMDDPEYITGSSGAIDMDEDDILMEDEGEE